MALASAAGALAWRLLEPAARRPAAVGLAAAWAVSTVSVAVLVLKRHGPYKTFLRAFGAGVALRGLVLAALMGAVWGKSPEEQAPLLGAYTLGVLGLLLVEYRHLMVKKK